MLSAFPGGVWVVPLASAQDGAQVPGAVALAIGMPSEGAVTVEALRDRLRDDRPTLIVLDTCEHLIGACATLAVRLVPMCPNVSVLATSREPLKTADEIATRMLSAIRSELVLAAGDRVAVMVNGLGATPPEELYIVYRKVHDLLGSDGVRVHRAYVGEYATSMEMAGCSLTVFKLDDELAALLDHPAHTPFFTQV